MSDGETEIMEGFGAFAGTQLPEVMREERVQMRLQWQDGEYACEECGHRSDEPGYCSCGSKRTEAEKIIQEDTNE